MFFLSSRAIRVFCVFCLFMGLFPSASIASSSAEPLSEAIGRSGEVVLDGHVGYNREGMVLFTSSGEQMVVLEDVLESGEPGQHIMVVGYPYKKNDLYHLKVVGYTFLPE